MNQVRLPKVSVAVIGLVVASIFHATPVLGAILTRQEFSGNFTLVDATSPFLTNSLPFKSEYSLLRGLLKVPDFERLGAIRQQSKLEERIQDLLMAVT